MRLSSFFLWQTMVHPPCFQNIGSERRSLYHPDDKPFDGFVDRASGETRIEDPRLNTLPLEWRNGANNHFKRTLHRYVNDETGEGYGRMNDLIHE